MGAILQTNFKHDTFYSFVREDQTQKVYYGDELMMCVNLSDTRELKQAIIYFLKIGVSVNWLSKAFLIARQTITQWYSIYQADGMDELFNFRKGPKKITEGIQAYIIAKFKDLEFCRNYKRIICEKVEEHFKVKIHWRSVAEILVKSGIDLSVKLNNRKIEQSVDLEVHSKEEHICLHAGLFFIYPYLMKLGIEKLFSSVRKLFTNTRYTVMEYIYGLLFFYASNKITVEENIKVQQDKRLEMVIGEGGLPSLRSYRTYIPRIIKEVDIKEFEYMLARNYYKGHDACYELYIDGHFMPYHGQYETFKGYNPIRRFAQKGRVGYFINNNGGRPFFYILSDGYKDFREYLLEIAQNISEITQEKNNKKLILVFDRGGWGADFCDELSSEITFICWRRGNIRITSGLSWEQVTVEKKTNKYGIYKKEILEVTEEVKCELDGKRIKRYIYIKRGEKISSAFSNDPDRSVAELVSILTKRWGLQENVFKGLKGMGIDKISSYKYSNYPENWILEETEEREVLNPQKRIIEERIAELKAEIKRITEELGKLSIAGKKSISKRMENLRCEKEKKEEAVRQLKEESALAQDKVNITEIIYAKNIVRLNSEKKKFFDLMKVLSYNVQQDIVDTIRPIYDNERDVNMFVRQLLDQQGSVVMDDEKITISFKPFRSTKKNNVLNYLIDSANKMNIKHPILNVTLHFRCS